MQKNQTVVIVLGLVVLTGLLLTTISLLRVDDQKLANHAWSVFEQYIAAAEANDLEMLKELSWELSPVCQAALEGNRSEEELLECQSLMDNVASIGHNFSREDFPYLAHENSLISLYSDYTDGMRTVIQFTQTVEDELKVSGIMFCMEGSEPVAKCFDKEVLQVIEPAELGVDISPETVQENFNSLFPTD